MATKKDSYPASFDIDYPSKMDRFTTFVRIIWVIPIFIILSILTVSGDGQFMQEAGK